MPSTPRLCVCVCAQVWTLVGEDARLAAAKDTSAAPVIDITKHGEAFSFEGVRCWVWVEREGRDGRASA